MEGNTYAACLGKKNHGMCSFTQQAEKRPAATATKDQVEEKLSMEKPFHCGSDRVQMLEQAFSMRRSN